MHGKIDWPLQRNVIRAGRLNHTFGMVRRNRDGSRRPHQGWDFEAPIGTPCFAIASGTVTHVRDKGDYGQQLVIQFEHDFDDDGDPDTLFAFYAHLSRVDVVAGQRVELGQHIGLTGDSGNARGMRETHLHFELRTVPLAGRGLVNRYSPMALFRHCPLREPVYLIEEKNAA